jgi:hypothetical protein
MRRTTAAWVLGAAVALLSGRAAATENKGDTGGKGGLGPQEKVESTTTGPDTSTVVPIQRNVDSSKKTEQEKPWEIGASFETHRMFIQDDGAGNNKVFNTFAAYALYRITDRDTLGIQEFVTEGFIADPGEPATQAADPAVTYTHGVPLPRDFLFRVSASLSAPMSLQSQKSGLITSPHLTLGLNKKVGRYINVSANVTGGLFIARYAEQEGGGANPLASVSAGLNAEVMMPFHEPLSFGVSVSDIYAWFYNVQSGDQSITAPGVVADATYPNQPVFQQYGGEIYGRYTLPTLAGAKGDISVSVADGDPGLGYNNYLHDGIGYTYLAYRLTGEVYAALTLRY